ncbi:MAG: cytochrome c [Hyphomicrobiales bacterium]|nr:cytochrome c [Hyphomicrobiales bacterium]MCY4053609.1 cytochrome c [Hyphomicrobiales bacterium]
MRIAIAITLLALGAVLPAAMAQEGDVQALIEQRHQEMKANGGAMKQLGGIFRGDAPYDRDAVIKAAGILSKHSGTDSAALFPDNSLEHSNSDARIEIADNRKRFEQIFSDLNAGSKELADLARSDGSDKELRALFSKVAKTCSACHTDFRAKN